MDREDGNYFIKHLATYIRTHEKALANALQLQTRRPSMRSTDGQTSPTNAPATSASTSSTLAAAFSMPSLSFASQNVKPAKLALTPHHLYYLLERFETLGISVGPMNVRLESIHAETAPGNYVSFLDGAHRARRSKSTDALSIHSVSSVKSVMSGMSSLWNSFGLGSGSSSKAEKNKQAINTDLKYIYSAFTKIPCLKLCPDPKARLISGYEEFPFDTAVPLLAFKNVTALEIVDIDIRQFYGWDQVAERVRSLVVKRACIEDPAELLIAIVLDDMDKRRRRSSKNQASPMSWSTPSPGLPLGIDTGSTASSPGKQGAEEQGTSVGSTSSTLRDRSAVNRPASRNRDRDSSNSPTRPTSSRSSSTANNGNHHSHYGNHKSHRMRRSDSGSSRASSNGTNQYSTNQYGTTTQSISLMGTLPSTKWRFLRHLSLADNSLTSISFASLAPLAGSLTSLDLSSNLFLTVPDALSTLTALRALNLSNNMIDSLHSLTRHPLPAITALNLRGNRLQSLAGIERLPSLERLDLRENKLSDPTELARLTNAPNFREVWIYPNPFVRTHNSTYRVTIFNLFRKTPGFTEDINIDAQGPGMMERRLLIERAPEPIPVPVVKPVSTAAPPREIVRPTETRQTPHHVRSHSEKGPLITTRPTDDLARARKKSTKRRVVELSKGDGGSEIYTAATRAPSFSPADFQGHRPIATPALPTYPSRPQFPASPPSPPTSLRQRNSISIDAETPPTPPPKDITLTPNITPGENWTIKGDAYKKKVELMKSELGNGWLSALADERWNSDPKDPQSPPNRDSMDPPRR
ncbi:hypothetical protein H072_7525 [Dactylellina haptotyla CBS 200.50]|uniref:Leucine-rich repeat-containing protein n=1 Tax=Dactylellina haptotyla (strain CBS 200.50) TaxID=1284197 RepID=S8BHB0_DACHA|nr:hypothetical protein H072_7525 [Dactylellina haptotyla CBS 200.50]